MVRHAKQHSHLWPRLRIPALLTLLALPPLSGCVSSGPSLGDIDPADDPVAGGTITYPFVDETRAIGRDRPEDKFVIRSAVGDREYTVEIPGAARDYDVQIPLADIGEKDPDVLAGRKPRQLPSPVSTDQEMVAALPRLDKDRPTDTALMDAAFGVGNTEGPTQAPSYTLGIAKINQYFRQHQYPYALVELNSLIAFYPNSPKLQKMKGTVLLKMRQWKLAELAWIKALDLDPTDRAVRAALAKLQKRILASNQSPVAGPPGPTLPVPAPVGIKPSTPESALAH